MRYSRPKGQKPTIYSRNGSDSAREALILLLQPSSYIDNPPPPGYHHASLNVEATNRDAGSILESIHNTLLNILHNITIGGCELLGMLRLFAITHRYR